MSLKLCLENAVAGGELSQEEASKIARVYEGFWSRYRAEGQPGARSRAKNATAAQLKLESQEQKRRAMLTAVAQNRLEADLDRYLEENPKATAGQAAIFFLEHYGRAPFSSVDGRRKTILGQAHARLSELIMEFERTALTGSTPRIDDLNKIVREAFGEETGDPRSKALAEIWSETADGLRQRFNRAGGAIGKLENWGLPQSHNRLALLKAGKAKWKRSIQPLLDPSRMRHPLTDEPISFDDLDAVLDDVFDTIVTDGGSKRTANRLPLGRGALAGQRAEHRFLTFKNADAWLEYQRDFGEGNPFATMMSHLNLMARDIAALEILGPNPNGSLAYLEQRVSIEGAQLFADGNKRAKSAANSKIREMRNMWDGMRGAAETPVRESSANFFAAWRNLKTASVMGSAFISAFSSDPAFQLIARKMSGLPMLGVMRDVARQFSKMDRAEAVRAGLTLDSALHTFQQQARYVGALEGGPIWTRWFADRTLTLSGMTAWSQANKHAFGMTYLGEIAQNRRHGFTDLPINFREGLERYGIGAEDWDKIRSAQVYSPRERDATYIRPQEIREVDPALADRVLEMVLQETEFAVPSNTVRGRALVVGESRPGELGGEIRRSFAMFKSFPVTLPLTYGARILEMADKDMPRAAAYASALLVSTTLGGIMGIWLKDIANGRDPRPLVDEDGNATKFMLAAMLQGGGLGIYGDFMFGDLNRFGGGFATTLTGPIVSDATDAWNMVAGNLVQLGAHEDTNFMEEFRRLVGRNIPGSTMWYWRLAYQRLAMDQLEKLTDPSANQQFKARQRRHLKEYGSGYWWRPGEATPDRLPSSAGGPN